MDDLAPSKFCLSQNYPNPFSDKTIIKYCIAYKTKVKLEVFSAGDKMVKRLLDEEKEAGTYEVEFDVSACRSSESADGGGNPQAEAYFYRFEAGEYRSEKKMVLMECNTLILP